MHPLTKSICDLVAKDPFSDPDRKRLSVEVGSVLSRGDVDVIRDWRVAMASALRTIEDTWGDRAPLATGVLHALLDAAACSEEYWRYVQEQQPTQPPEESLEVSMERIQDLLRGHFIMSRTSLINALYIYLPHDAALEAIRVSVESRKIVEHTLFVRGLSPESFYTLPGPEFDLRKEFVRTPVGGW